MAPGSLKPDKINWFRDADVAAPYIISENTLECTANDSA